jgi:hypothetical protein
VTCFQLKKKMASVAKEVGMENPAEENDRTPTDSIVRIRASLREAFVVVRYPTK